MPSDSAKKLTAFVVLGLTFGILCMVLGIGNGNYALLGAGVLATGGGLALTLMAIFRKRPRE